MHASPSALRELANHLAIVSKNNRSHGGGGFTYDQEVEQLRAAATELEQARKLGGITSAVLPWAREREGRPGDRFEHKTKGVVVTVESQADGNVYWTSKSPADAVAIDCQNTVEEWHRLVTQAMDGGDVVFTPGPVSQ